ncbi:uncharacterized protein PHACADRAFT_262924 [Phanerochaete carnosa HHB-10118-sp]|uniref:Methylated-DNA-[protein]-cysteine S-methyltransferase DNA binding domain-containing protein n=1 Tax=Phanerochaete carnosa (strain HHB-10118-sp) TaxID=650164 RepID=K5VIA0_PHACS|nr:uncharacterized protein PHACADRAFT_262924 [Phanerochaete carnosa HHB-10118-sp]EKM50993.1 hypothetical protein PHACADRAFT_262924 [Phanerochaete carnosa HHB-10118-sp]
MPRHSRHVGQALKWLSPDAAPPVPWQRVVASNGTISSRGPGTDGAERQRATLEAEGVEVVVGRSGDMRVNFEAYGWFPAPGTVATGAPQPDAPAEEEQDGEAGDLDELTSEEEEEDADGGNS